MPEHGERLARIEEKVDTVVTLLGGRDSGLIKEVDDLKKVRWISYGIVILAVAIFEGFLHK